jgi:hypothetical protein
MQRIGVRTRSLGPARGAENGNQRLKDRTGHISPRERTNLSARPTQDSKTITIKNQKLMAATAAKPDGTGLLILDLRFWILDWRRDDSATTDFEQLDF